MNPDDDSSPVRKAGLIERRVRLLSVVLMVCVFSITGGSADKPDLDGFAKCLASRKATMYGSFLCSHCEDQKHLFGSSFKYVPYVECSTPGTREMAFSCRVEMIRYTPTWIFPNDERLVGLQSLKTLSEKTGCPLP